MTQTWNENGPIYNFKVQFDSLIKGDIYWGHSTVTQKIIKIGYCHCNGGYDSNSWFLKRNEQIKNDLGYYFPVLEKYHIINVYDSYVHEQEMLRKTSATIQLLYNKKGANPVFSHFYGDFNYLTEYRNITWKKALELLNELPKNKNSVGICYVVQYTLTAPKECFPSQKHK
jgi:hypothetical protein